MPKFRYIATAALLMFTALVVVLIAGAMHHQVVIRVMKGY
jgi:hypothetical protein